MEENDNKKTAFLDFAVSNNSDPTNGFSEMHRISVKEGSPSNSFWADFPRLGWNADAYVWTFNMYKFPSGTGNFDHVQILSVNKSTVLDSDNSTYNQVQVDGNTGDFNLTPGIRHGSVSGDSLWLVEEDSNSNKLRLVQMSNVLSSTPTFTDYVVSVPAYNHALPPRQPGGQITTNIDSGILNVATEGNLLVASQNVSNGGTDQARFYEFNLAGPSPNLLQTGDINRGPGVDSYFPSVDISSTGNVGMTFLESSSNEFMSMYVTGRAPADQVGFLRAPELAQAGQAIYNGSRAGDFSGVSVDPNDGSFWAANEFSNHESINWGTWIAHFVVNPSANVSMAEDFDGDGKADLAFWRPTDGTWNILTSRSSFTKSLTFTLGAFGDVPIQGDFDGDGRSDLAVWRPSNGTWYVSLSSTNYKSVKNYQWGLPGEGKNDLAVWRTSNSTWYVRTSSTGFTNGPIVLWGNPGDMPIPTSDFDGDGKADMVVWRPSNATWFVLTSGSNFTNLSQLAWGTTQDEIL